MKQPFTSRIEENDLTKAFKMGIDLPDLFRASLATVIKSRRCPTCGRRISPLKKDKIKKEYKRKTKRRK